MYTLANQFAHLVENTNPTGERQKVILDQLPMIRDHLRRHELQSIEPHTLLSGSYARKTAVGDIKDVDVLLILDPGFGEQTPSIVIREIEAALLDYNGAEIDTAKQRRSVRLNIPQHDLDLDIVGVIAPGGLDEKLLIPDRLRQKWVETHPLGYKKKLTELNQDQGSKVKPAVRLLKLWRDLNMTYKKPKSYWLECLVYYSFDREDYSSKGKSTAEIFRDILDYVVCRLGPTVDAGGVPRIYDPMLGNNICSGWEQSHAEAFVGRVRDHLELANKALGVGTEQEAIDIWDRVFPSLISKASSSVRLSTAIGEGRAAVTSSGLLLGSRPQDAIKHPPVRAHGGSNRNNGKKILP